MPRHFEEWQYLANLHLGVMGGFLAMFVFFPATPDLAAALRRRWRAPYTAAAIAAGVVGLSAFIVYFGCRHFGAWDHGIMVDAGWRVTQGQRLYQDFVSPMPSGFFLGTKLAFQVFGVRWISTVYATALLAAVCFVWMYFLFAELLGRRLPAFLTAFCIECVSMLLLSYWWYNNETSVTAVVFLLSCLLYLKQSGRLAAQISYAVSLTMLGFMKANTAGLLIFAGVLLLMLGLPKPDRARFLMWTAAATAANLAILAINHVSVSGLLASYWMSVRERGQTLAYGVVNMPITEVPRSAVGFVILCSAFLAWWPQFRLAVARRDRPAVAGLLLLAAAAASSIMAMCTSLEFKDVDFPLLIAAGAVLLSHPKIAASQAIQWRLLVRVYVCFLAALAAGDIYSGVVRYRVSRIGPFFEWSEPLVDPGTRFFEGMRSSPALREVLTETAQALRNAPRPVFFGPRMEFAYAAFGEPSPAGLGVFWCPGTAFAWNDESLMEERWRQKKFRTVIFLKASAIEADSTYYRDIFRKMIVATYRQEGQWGSILVLEAKKKAAQP